MLEQSIVRISKFSVTFHGISLENTLHKNRLSFSVPICFSVFYLFCTKITAGLEISKVRVAAD